MKDNILNKIVNHPDKDDIINSLIMETSPEDIYNKLKTKYGDVSKSLVISKKNLIDFKSDYLNCYLQIQKDATALKNTSMTNVEGEVKAIVQNNSVYRQKLEDYLDQEIDIKKLVKNLIVAIEFRVVQVFDKIQDNPTSTKMDYVLINYMNSLVNILEKYDTIINGSSDKIMQQNNINIQILDQHVSVIQKVVREVISRLDHDMSLIFVDILTEELDKLKPADSEELPVDIRLSEARQLGEKVSQRLDMPTF